MGPETEPEEQTQNPSTSYLPIYSAQIKFSALFCEWLDMGGLMRLLTSPLSLN